MLEYTESLAIALSGTNALGAPVRIHRDQKPVKAVEKRWDWIRRGAPLIVEIGPRDTTKQQVTYLRRDAITRNDGKANMQTIDKSTFLARAGGMLEEIQSGLYTEARRFRDNRIIDGIENVNGLAEYFSIDPEDVGSGSKGWVRAGWCQPNGDEMRAVEEQLKALTLTIRNAPSDQPLNLGRCIFSGKEATEQILIGRSY